MTKIITSIAAAAVLSTSLFAGSIDVTVDGATIPAAPTPTTVSSSLAKNAEYDVIVGNGSTTRITYTPTTAIGENYTAVVTITNGAFAAGNDWELVVSDVTSGNELAGATAATLTDFVTDANGDYTSMTFVFSDTVNTDGFAFDTKFTLGKGSANGWNINIAQGATANVNIAVPSVKTATAVDLVAPVAAASTVLSIGNPLTATFVNDATTGNTIDVEQGRLVFLGNGTDGDNATAEGVLTISTGAATIKYVLDNALDTWTLTVSGDMTGINGMTIGGNAMTADVAYPNTTSFTFSSDFATDDLTAGLDLIAATDGTTVLDTRTLTADLSIDDTNDNANVAPAADLHTLMSNTDTLELDINGYQAYSPYVIASADTNTYVKIVNDNSLSGDVTFDVTDENGNTATNLNVKTVFNAAYAPLAGNSTGTYSAHDILAAAQVQNSSIGEKFAVKMTVNSPKADVYATVVQTIDGNRERVFQVYHDVTGYLAQ